MYVAQHIFSIYNRLYKADPIREEAILKRTSNLTSICSILEDQDLIHLDRQGLIQVGNSQLNSWRTPIYCNIPPL